VKRPKSRWLSSIIDSARTGEPAKWRRMPSPPASSRIRRAVATNAAWPSGRFAPGVSSTTMAVARPSADTRVRETMGCSSAARRSVAASDPFDGRVSTRSAISMLPSIARATRAVVSELTRPHVRRLLERPRQPIDARQDAGVEHVGCDEADDRDPVGAEPLLELAVGNERRVAVEKPHLEIGAELETGRARRRRERNRRDEREHEPAMAQHRLDESPLPHGDGKPIRRTGQKPFGLPRSARKHGPTAPWGEGGPCSHDDEAAAASSGCLPFTRRFAAVSPQGGETVVRGRGSGTPEGKRRWVAVVGRGCCLAGHTGAMRSVAATGGRGRRSAKPGAEPVCTGPSRRVNRRTRAPTRLALQPRQRRNPRASAHDRGARRLLRRPREDGRGNRRSASFTSATKRRFAPGSTRRGRRRSARGRRRPPPPGSVPSSGSAATPGTSPDSSRWRGS
jgi:hypothetical protein